MLPKLFKMVKQTGTIILWILIFTGVFYFLIHNVPPILGIGPETLDQRRAAEKVWLITHLCFGTAALILGAIQFRPGIRNKFIRWHRNAGKLYIICSIVAALMAFYLLSNYNLPGSIPGLMLLSLIWLFTTIIAFLFAKKGDFITHRKFMIRSYICALAFVSIRLLDKIDYFTGLFSFIKDPETRATIVDWIGWLIPLMITEFFLQWWPSLKKLNKTAKNSVLTP